MINLQKKSALNLTKSAPGLDLVRLGLSWDETVLNGSSPDADSSVVMLNAAQKLPSDGFLVFYNNLTSADGAVRHYGDSRTGAGDGDDEVIDITLSRVDASINQILLYITIHNSDRGFNFGNVSNASVRVYNGAAVLCEFRVTENFPTADCLLIGQFYRDPNDGWQFQAIGDGSTGGLAFIAQQYS